MYHDLTPHLEPPQRCQQQATVKVTTNDSINRLALLRVTPQFLTTSVCWAAAFTISITFGAAVFASGENYTKPMFVEALNKGGFVFVTLRDGATGSERRVCTLEAALLGAIHTQYHIDYDEKGRKEAEEIALKHWNEPFTFANAEAFHVVEPSYTQSQLNEVREQLSSYDKSALSKQLDDPNGAIDRIYTNPYRESYRDAVAHVLLENGILVGVDDRTPMLRLLEEDEAARFRAWEL
ncbi:MAG: hypothetical protein WCE87_14345 [Candidatus Udaeobacter sp.]